MILNRKIVLNKKISLPISNRRKTAERESNKIKPDDTGKSQLILVTRKIKYYQVTLEN